MNATRFAFHHPVADDEYWTDEALEGLVGQIVSVTAFDVEFSKARIVSARRREDSPTVGRGLWVEVELPVGEVES